MAAPHHIDAWHGWSLDVEADGRSATVRAPGPGHRHHLDRQRHSQDRRARRARLFCDAYGLQDRGELVDKILERQRAGRRAIKQAADAGDPACQRLWDMGAGAGVQRQIGDVLAHRSALQDALTLTAGPADKRRTRCGHPPAGMTGRKTPQHHTGHTEPIRTPALRHSIDGNHPELREGQEDSALTA